MVERDLLTVTPAARLARKSPDTIRRWLKQGKLKNCQRSKASNAPALISRAELLALCKPATTTGAEKSPPATPRAMHRATRGAMPGAEHGATVEALRAQIATLAAEVETLKARLAHADETQAFLERQLENETRRSATLQMELLQRPRVSAPRGLLSAAREWVESKLK